MAMGGADSATSSPPARIQDLHSPLARIRRWRLDPVVSPVPLTWIRRLLRREGLDPATFSSPARIPSSLHTPLMQIHCRCRQEGLDPAVSTVVTASLLIREDERSGSGAIYLTKLNDPPYIFT